MIGLLVVVTGFGLNVTESTINRSPAGPTSETGITLELPPPPPPPPPLGVSALTAGVGSECAAVEPAEFLPVTRSRIRLPTSLFGTVYVWPVTPLRTQL